MDGLRHLIGLRRRGDDPPDIRNRRHFDPRQFHAAETGKICDIGGMIVGQPESADVVGNSQATKVLHRA
jgi:hypothetical protein